MCKYQQGLLCLRAYRPERRLAEQLWADDPEQHQAEKQTTTNAEQLKENCKSDTES